MAAARRLRGGAYLDLGGGPADSALIAGTGRSGTTWISGMIARSGGYRLVFEPFDAARVPLARAFASKQYLRPDDDREEFLGPAREILSGRVRGGWVDRHNRRSLPRRRVIKDIRANLLLGWISAHFPETPLVLVLRHPLAVVRSRLRLGWRDNLDETMRQTPLLEDFLGPFEARIRGARTPFERHLFLWCIDNLVPLVGPARGRLRILFYEDVARDPRGALEPLLASLGVEPRPAALREATHVPPGGRRIAGWRGEASPEEVSLALEALSLFGLGGVYGEGPLPDPSGLPPVPRSG